MRSTKSKKNITTLTAHTIKKALVIATVTVLAGSSLLCGCGATSNNDADGQEVQSALGNEEENTTEGIADAIQQDQEDSVEACNHEWNEATCELPETCALCGETRGEALGHTWDEAIWPNRRTCTVCGKVEEDVLTPDKGDIVTFGAYEQDDNLENGFEPIEWLVIDVQDGRMLLLSKYILDSVPYNTKWERTCWNTCTLRTWCNDTFYNAAFTEDDKERIAETTLSNPDNMFHNEDWELEDTNDKVFCLSVDEVMNYFDLRWFKSTGNLWPITIKEFDSRDDIIEIGDEWRWRIGMCQELICEPTVYASNVTGIYPENINKGKLQTWTVDNKYPELRGYRYDESYVGLTTAAWWLRSMGGYYDAACFVEGADINFEGIGPVTVHHIEAYSSDGMDWNEAYDDGNVIGVRPALWVNL